MKITILGCGAYALALKEMFLENDCNIIMWSKIVDEVKMLKNKYTNIEFTCDLGYSISNTNLIVIAIPIEYLESVIISLKDCYNNSPILIATKGISQDGSLFATEIIDKYIKVGDIGVISGGTFASDMIDKYVMGLSLATRSDVIKERVFSSLKCKYLDIEITDDLIGVQVCGSVKNVVAIGMGILDGLGYPESTKYLFLTKSIYEIRNLIEILGGKRDTIISYAGLDDIIMTSSSIKSRNYTLGKMIGDKMGRVVIDDYINNTTIEGLYTSKSIYNIISSKNISSPILTLIYDILYLDKDCDCIINYLENSNM